MPSDAQSEISQDSAVPSLPQDTLYELGHKRLHVVLDLDNTLIHSVQLSPLSTDFNYFKIKDGIYVYKRPHLDLFLTELLKVADVSLFTASKKDYAD